MDGPTDKMDWWTNGQDTQMDDEMDEMHRPHFEYWPSQPVRSLNK